ncbi:beta-N-acetylhexosaminidase [Niabella insulamsoli]|uniref:beta-N-acetylhexosaminidase n=1 Tax=Niabella insulamsoli TaxID=3144874 RepID=UPI0031FC1CE1
MNLKLFSAVFTFIVTPLILPAQNHCPVIPQPQQATLGNGQFLLSQRTALVVSDASLKNAALYLQQQMLQQQHIAVAVQPAAKSLNRIILSIDKDFQNEEGYSLSVKPDAIEVSAATPQGVFYGTISLLQLLEQGKQTDEGLLMDCWNIKDAPRYGWRGLMLDESRHFFGMEKVKSILNWMAYYKLNRFHWHLTDEPAWRIEIKNYPKLALIGGIGTHTNPQSPAQFYTQQQIAEIVNYAAERNIVVIPEIDMPGHATAANRAYPEFSGGGSEKHPEFTFNPGKPETYTYLANILREVNALFPSRMIHLGGDEVSFGNQKWQTNPDIKNLMGQNNLKNVHEVESYFMQRMADTVYSLNAKLLAWDEVANMNFPTEKTIVFWWRHDQPAQLEKTLSKGYEAVICPRLPLYFDFVQDSTHTVGRKWGKGFSPIEDVYRFDINTLPGVNAKTKKQVLGVQANVWTETMVRPDQLDFMLFPRIAALSELGWTSSERKDYEAFSQILKTQFPLYRKEALNFYNPFKN